MKANIYEFKENSSYHESKSKKADQKIWKDEEDIILIEQSKLHKKSSKKWKQVSHYLPGKTPKQCYSRFRQVNPEYKQGVWTKEEEYELRSLVAKYGRKWAEIAKIFKTRSGKQIRHHYINILDEKNIKSAFSVDDDIKLKDLYFKYGPKWKKISANFNGRTADSIKNRFYNKIRHFIEPNTLCNTSISHIPKKVGKVIKGKHSPNSARVKIFSCSNNSVNSNLSSTKSINNNDKKNSNYPSQFPSNNLSYVNFGNIINYGIYQQNSNYNSNTNANNLNIASFNTTNFNNINFPTFTTEPFNSCNKVIENLVTGSNPLSNFNISCKNESGSQEKPDSFLKKSNSFSCLFQCQNKNENFKMFSSNELTSIKLNLLVLGSFNYEENMFNLNEIMISSERLNSKFNLTLRRPTISSERYLSKRHERYLNGDL